TGFAAVSSGCRASGEGSALKRGDMGSQYGYAVRDGGGYTVIQRRRHLLCVPPRPVASLQQAWSPCGVLMVSESEGTATRINGLFAIPDFSMAFLHCLSRGPTTFRFRMYEPGRIRAQTMDYAPPLIRNSPEDSAKHAGA